MLRDDATDSRRAATLRGPVLGHGRALFRAAMAIALVCFGLLAVVV